MSRQHSGPSIIKSLFAGSMATLAAFAIGYAFLGESIVSRVSAEPPDKAATTQPAREKGSEDKSDRKADGRAGDRKAERRALRRNDRRDREMDDDRDGPPEDDRDGPPRRPRWRDRRDIGRHPRDDGPDGPDDRGGPRRGRFARPGGPDDREMDSEDFELPPEAVKELRELIRTELPVMYERLEEWRERNPQRFRMAMLRVYPAFRDYSILRDRNPELAATIIEELKIEVEIRKLSEQYQAVAEESAERTAIETQLAEKVRRQLDIRMARREDRLAELSKKLKREKEKLQAEKSQIESACAERLKQIKKGKFTDFFEGPKGGLKPRRGPRDGFGPEDDDGPPPPRRRADGERDHGRDRDGDRDEEDDGPPPDDDRPPRGHHPPRGRFGPP